MKRLVGYILLVAILASTSSCWNWNLAREGELDPPDRPRVDQENGLPTPEWMNPPGMASDSLEDRDVHRTTTEGSARRAPENLN